MLHDHLTHGQHVALFGYAAVGALVGAAMSFVKRGFLGGKSNLVGSAVTGFVFALALTYLFMNGEV